ncbi:hypothetical protein OF83DRAFT_1179178 [Amylostereum chailletii]|nr:hypothetical protein OF83DRAFT_1179178 [Amylostereum chailletii]
MSVVQTTGSLLNPKTYDCILILAKLAPTTTKTAIYDPIAKMIMPVCHGDTIVRVGVWTYGAVYPKRGKGLRLQGWEHVSGLTVRFTVPYLMDETEMDDADPLNIGTTEGIWTDETSEQEVYELYR